MIVKHRLNLDLIKRGVTPRIDAVQDDRCSRALEIHLFANGVEFTPPEDATVFVRYKKPDGTGGAYDTLPDGESAWSIADGAVNVTLAPQVCTVAGTVELAVTLLWETAEISTFLLLVDVQASPGGAETSREYVNIKAFLPQPGNVTVGQYLMVTEVDAYGNATVIGSGAVPAVTLDAVDGGCRISVIDPDGSAKTAMVTDGKDGAGITDIAAQEVSNIATNYETMTEVTVSVEEPENGIKHYVFHIPHGKDGADGKAGNDGVGIVSIGNKMSTESGGYNEISITTSDGMTTVFQIRNGYDGFSSVISAEEIDGGHRISMTSPTGGQTFDVMDGAQGEKGEKGDTGEQGEKGEPGADALDILQCCYASAKLPMGRARGDVDGNGIIDEADNAVMNDHILGSTTITDEAALWAADFDSDGVIGSGDNAKFRAVMLGNLAYGQFAADYYGNWLYDSENGYFYYDVAAAGMTESTGVKVIPARQLPDSFVAAIQMTGAMRFCFTVCPVEEILCRILYGGELAGLTVEAPVEKAFLDDFVTKEQVQTMIAEAMSAAAE